MCDVNRAVKLIASCLLPGGCDKLYPGLNQSQVSLSPSHSLTAGKGKKQMSANLPFLHSYTHLTPFDLQKLKELGQMCELRSCF